MRGGKENKDDFKVFLCSFIRKLENVHSKDKKKDRKAL